MLNFLILFVLVVGIFGVLILSNNSLTDKIKFPKKLSSSLCALLSSFICFLISLLEWVLFNGNTIKFQNIVVLGIPLGVDGISIYFILLTTILFPICILISWKSNIHSKLFLSLFLFLELLLILVFMTIDLLWFYIFFESVLIPILIIIGIWGSRSRKIKAGIYFFMFTLIGSLVILTSILYIYIIKGTTIYLNLLSHNFTPTEEKWLWFAFFLSFSVKVPIIPFHIWLPEAHVEAPTVGSVILAGILLKLGVYGFIRYSIPIFPQASIYFTPIINTICLISIFYSSFTAIRQTDLKKIIAYTSIAHINLVVIGIFSYNIYVICGCVIQSISHGLVSSGLFFLVGVLYEQQHTRLYLHYGGLVHIIPIFSFFFLAFTIANIALPGTSSFIGEFLLLLGIFSTNTIAAFLGALTLIWGGIYSLWLFNRIVYGNLKVQYLHEFKDLTSVEIFCFSFLFGLVIILGFFPEIVLNDLQMSLNICSSFLK
jgi:proton-translocating NADH-quinone oxidoreductase chain M